MQESMTKFAMGPPNQDKVDTQIQVKDRLSEGLIITESDSVDSDIKVKDDDTCPNFYGTIQSARELQTISEVKRSFCDSDESLPAIQRLPCIKEDAGIRKRG